MPKGGWALGQVSDRKNDGRVADRQRSDALMDGSTHGLMSKELGLRERLVLPAAATPCASARFSPIKLVFSLPGIRMGGGYR